MTNSSPEKSTTYEVHLPTAPEYRNDRVNKSTKRVIAGTIGSALVSAAGGLLDMAEHRPNTDGINSWASHDFSPEFLRTVTPDRIIDSSIGILGATIIYGIERVVSHYREKRVFNRGWSQGLIDGSLSTAIAVATQRDTEAVDKPTERQVLFDQDIQIEPDQDSINEVFDQGLPLGEV